MDRNLELELALGRGRALDPRDGARCGHLDTDRGVPGPGDPAAKVALHHQQKGPPLLEEGILLQPLDDHEGVLSHIEIVAVVERDRGIGPIERLDRIPVTQGHALRGLAPGDLARAPALDLVAHGGQMGGCLHRPAGGR